MLVPELEKKDALKRRIEQASKVVPLENLCLSPQCGFSSTHHGNNLTVEQEKAKLKLCIDTAKEVWGSLAIADRFRTPASSTCASRGAGSG